MVDSHPEDARWRPTQVGTAFLCVLAGLFLVAFPIGGLSWFEELQEVGVQTEIVAVDGDGLGSFETPEGRRVTCGHGGIGDLVVYHPDKPHLCRPADAVVWPIWYEWLSIGLGAVLFVFGVFFGIFGRRTPGTRSFMRPGEPLG